MARCKLALLLIHISFCVARPSGEGLRIVTPTVGAPWPMPQKYATTGNMYTIDPKTFKFVATGQICDIVDAAFGRYQQIIFSESSTTLKCQPKNKFHSEDALVTIAVNVKMKCDKFPSLDMDESCKYIILNVKYHDQLTRNDKLLLDSSCLSSR